MEQVFQVNETPRPHREEIKVVGVGGGGGNALNHIIRSGVTGVHFIAANTDVGSLNLSQANSKVTLGEKLTKGLGAGSDPTVGMNSAKESIDKIREVVSGADMVFITAGMGGGTGTGASPIIAEVAKEAGALVVAVVTFPFSFEMNRRRKQAAEGITVLREKVDALLVVENDRLLELTDEKTKHSEAYKLADEVLRQAVQGVTDLILKPSLINVDFADVRTVMQNAGSAIMGIGSGDGENRAETAAKTAIKSPLMSIPMKGAKGILFNITGGPDLGIHEIRKAAAIITETADEDAIVIWGHTVAEDMAEKIQITVIATGFSSERERKTVTNFAAKFSAAKQKSPGVILEEAEVLPIQDEDMFSISGVPKNPYDIPSIIRRNKKQG
ncbi:MAG: cell division protein FtsZ [Synergistaceae bacterium]|nr:cell division protein FtsZ [Synergistota bacterium]NLM70628.1 cell division protein FtsZ [Synergistaceae bacterium]